MITEKATDRMDLPHAYDEVKMIQKECVCGRTKDHHLHDIKAREIASTGATLEREKGS